MASQDSNVGLQGVTRFIRLVFTKLLLQTEEPDDDDDTEPKAVKHITSLLELAGRV